jgi:hypothetical protein
MWQWGIGPHIYSVGPSSNKWSASYLFRSLPLPREIAPNNWLTGGWLGPRHGLGTLEKRKICNSFGIELRQRGRPVRILATEQLRLLN